MTRKMAHRKIDQVFSKAENMAIQYVQEEARRMMQQHEELDEFIMRMGTWFFRTVDGEIVGFEDRSYIEKCDLTKFIQDWDEYLRITGYAVRLKKNGPAITNW